MTLTRRWIRKRNGTRQRYWVNLKHWKPYELIELQVTLLETHGRRRGRKLSGTKKIIIKSWVRKGATDAEIKRDVLNELYDYCDKHPDKSVREGISKLISMDEVIVGIERKRKVKKYEQTSIEQWFW